MRLSENRLRGIFWGGLAGGLGSCLPLLALVNCFCCLWAWLAGALAVALIRRREPITKADVPKMGALAGAFAGLVSSTAQLIYSIAAGPVLESALGNLRNYLPVSVPEQSLEMLQQWSGSGLAMLAMQLVSALFLVAVFAVFGALGGLLYNRIAPPAPANEREAAADAAPEPD